MVDREGAVTEPSNMLSVHALTTQLQTQTLTESHAALTSSSHDESAAKIRHHSEPHPPASLLSDPNKKVKIITFQDGIHKDTMALTSILLSAESSTSSTWDNTGSNPPNKKQCRSMSIPNDGELHTHWLQTQARGHLHRPLALRPNGAGSRSKAHQISHHRHSMAGRNLPPVWSSLAPSDTSTPPESPRSRPSSASSGYFESPLASSSNLHKYRCESLQTLPSIDYTLQTNSAGSGMCGQAMRVIAAKSMPSVADSSSTRSPKQMLLRCQSQPCVIHERRCGVKRRRDEQRPSINFSKMTETALDEPTSECKVPSTRLSSPLKIRPVARYGQIFPDRVLQTIASSPQDMCNISTAMTSNSGNVCITNSPLPTSPPIATSALCRTDTNDSDSGCSATDDELCDITNKMATETVSTNVCEHKASPSCTTSSYACSCPQEPELETGIFSMEPHGASELDLDMIENN